jgi:hypothetical protein
VEREYQVPPETAPRNANVADDTNQPPAGHKNSKNMNPHFLELGEKILIIRDVPHLVGIIVVLLEVPIRRGGDYKMNRFIGDERNIPRVTVDEFMDCL